MDKQSFYQYALKNYKRKELQLSVMEAEQKLLECDIDRLINQITDIYSELVRHSEYQQSDLNEKI